MGIVALGQALRQAQYKRGLGLGQKKLEAKYKGNMDYFFGFQMVHGLEDTIKDMAMGLLGALVLSLLYRKR